MLGVNPTSVNRPTELRLFVHLIAAGWPVSFRVLATQKQGVGGSPPLSLLDACPGRDKSGVEWLYWSAGDRGRSLYKKALHNPAGAACFLLVVASAPPCRLLAVLLCSFSSRFITPQNPFIQQTYTQLLTSNPFLFVSLHLFQHPTTTNLAKKTGTTIGTIFITRHLRFSAHADQRQRQCTN